MGILNQFVPKDLQPFTKYIGPSALRVIDWKPVVHQSSQLGKRYFSNEKKSEVRQDINSILPEKLSFVSDQDQVSDVTLANNKELGDLLLELYFSQLHSPRSIIDMRGRFFKKISSDNFGWSPSNLWFEWDGPFREGLLALYKGYYLGDDSLLDKGLIKIQLRREDLSEKQNDHVKQLILAHVGAQDAEAMRFDLSQFESSFEKLFKTLKAYKISISSDFLFLGVYLVTLYATLQEVAVPLNVKKAFQNAHDRLA